MFVALNGVVNETLVVAEGVPTAVILEPPSVQLHEADLFNERAFPLRKEDLEELEAVDDFNEMLAEMDVMDAEHESVRRHALSNLQVLKEARNATRIRSMSAASEESSDGWLQKHNDFEHLLGGQIHDRASKALQRAEVHSRKAQEEQQNRPWRGSGHMSFTNHRSSRPRKS